jgi:hypothetical protein
MPCNIIYEVVVQTMVVSVDSQHRLPQDRENFKMSDVLNRCSRPLALIDLAGQDGGGLSLYAKTKSDYPVCQLTGRE